MKSVTMNNKKHILILIILGIMLVSAFLFRVKLINFYDSIFNQNLYANMMLTEEQKIEDFEYFYYTINTSYPMLDADKQVMGLDFLSKKDYYISLVKDIKTNFEFYCTMSSIAAELQSFHTDLVTPDYNQYKKIGCYNKKSTVKARHLKAKPKYWEKYLDEEFEKYKNDSLVFSYVDGNYIYDNFDSDTKYDDINNYSTIVSINHQPVIDFLIERTSIMAYRYDHMRNQTCKTRLVFNETEGERVDVSIQNKDGKLITKSLCVSTQNETLWLFQPSDKEETNMPVYHYQDRGFSYLKIDNFMGTDNGATLREVEKAIDSQNIIIDIRGKYGGTLQFIQKNLYGNLFTKDTISNRTWYMPKSQSNERIKKELTVFSRFHKSDDFTDSQNREYYVNKSSFQYRGQANFNDKEIYLLIDNYSGSAADNIASVIKDNKLGTVIGTNTHGEGNAGSFAMDYLPNSGLVFIYMPGISFNKDGTNNSLFGTAPDIYIEQTQESFYKKNELLLNGQDVTSFEGRMKWDNVLQDTIALIKKEEDN